MPFPWNNYYLSSISSSIYPSEPPQKIRPEISKRISYSARSKKKKGWVPPSLYQWSFTTRPFRQFQRLAAYLPENEMFNSNYNKKYLNKTQQIFLMTNVCNWIAKKRSKKAIFRAKTKCEIRVNTFWINVFV